MPLRETRELEMEAHLDDVDHFLFVQTAVSVSVINFERPSEFVLEFSTENQMNCCHIFQEVNFTVLEGARMVEGERHSHIVKSTHKSHLFLFSHLVCVKGFKHNFHICSFFNGGVAVNPEDSLKLVQVQIPAWTFTCKLPVEFLDVLETYLLFFSALCLTHDCKPRRAELMKMLQSSPSVRGRTSRLL